MAWANIATSEARSKTTTSYTEWSSSKTTESTIGTSIIPYMRGITIKFTATGLRPFTRVYPWFSGRNVSAYCIPDGGIAGGPLMTDKAGKLKGSLVVPAGIFATGVTSFVLVDNAETITGRYDHSTIATASFKSGGTLLTNQLTTVQTRVLGSTQRVETEYRRVDPIAQSFSVSVKGGVMLGSVDVFFRTKSDSIPITCEIRGMSNGFPTHEVLGRSVLDETQVSISDDASVPTRFSFSPSIYLNEDTEYAVVLLSNSTGYRAYLSEMGGTVVGGTQTISRQTNTGVFFSSSNGSTWTPHQTQDLKFNINREVYSTSPTVVLMNAETGSLSPRKLDKNCVYVTQGSQYAIVYAPFHSSRVGDTVTLSGLIGDKGVAASVLNKSHTVTTVNSLDRFTINLGVAATATGLLGGSDGFILSRHFFNLVNVNVDYTTYEGADVKFEIRYKLSSNRSMTEWITFTPSSDFLLRQEGLFEVPSDLQVRMTITSNGVLSPQVDIHGFTAVLNGFLVDPSQEMMRYVTSEIGFSNPSTRAKVMVSYMIPDSGNIKVYAKYIVDENVSGTPWTEIKPTEPVIVGSSYMVESTFDSGEIGSFSNMMLKVVMFGTRNNPPVIQNVRGVILA